MILHLIGKKEPQTEEAEILSLIKHKATRERGYAKLIAKYSQKVYWQIRRMVYEHEDADDLTQEVFIKVFENIESFNSSSKLSTWIYRIAVNKSINFIRKQKVRRLFAGREKKTLENTTNAGSDWSLREEQYKQYFDEALKALPEKQRTAFILYMYEELPQKEIAAVMNCSLPAVEVLVHRARKSMEKYITSLDKELLK